MRKWFAALAAVTVAVVTMAVMTPATPASAATDDAVFGISKTVVGGQTTFQPGDTFQYQITVSCSSTVTGGCVNANIQDALPAPLVLNPDASPQVTANLSPAGPVDVSYNGTTGFTVTPNETWVYNGASQTGMVSGHQLIITVSVQVPEDIPGTDNGSTITNTATADADNAPAASDTADISLNVPTTLDAGMRKNASVSTIPAIPGKPIDWTLTPTNESNQNVDTIVVQDPADINNPPTNLNYIDFTGVDITAPETTTSTETEYLVNGVWTTTPPVPPDTPEGIRTTFHGTYAPGASGKIVIHSVTNDQVTSIPSGDSVSIHNDASTVVEKNGESSDPATDSADVTMSANAPDVAITKSYGDNTLLAGQSTTASVQATVGAQDVESLTVNEPSDGQPGFAEQGVTFTGFGSGLTWPVAATQATITYNYTDCDSTTATTTTVNTLPDPQAGCTVDGFSVTYASPGTDGIQSGTYALLPINVTADKVLLKKSSTNYVDTSVTDTDNETGSSSTKADFTISPLTIDTNVTKKITPSQIFGVPGTTATVSLTGKVADTSTVGSDELVISDPNNPETDSSGFWNQFTADNVQTDIPNCSTLTVNYWSVSQGAYVPLPGAENIDGPQQNWTYTVPADLQSDIGGIQFVFKPSTDAGCDDTLPPGFNVTPNIGVETTQTTDTETTFTNSACSEVSNDSAVRSPQTDCASAPIDVLPIDDGGPGPQFVDKQWTQDTVPALSGDDRTTRIGWSTDGLKLKSMTITDPSTQGELDNVATSVFDAWNLKEINPITTTDDPLIAQDVISEVSLYENGAWVDITAAACASGCTGQFGGYTLSGTEQSTATGVRFVFSERTAGAGVGSSYDFNRPLNLTWTLRDTLRSNPSQYVLGSQHTYGYNTGDAGVVDNSVRGTGTTEDNTSYDSTANDRITILDSPVNVDMTKSFDQTALGLPQEGTAQADYPLISSTITATNNTAGKISSMAITDPDPAQAAPTVFDTLNLYAIAGITTPPGATANDTIVTLTGGPTAGTYPLAEAEALTPAQLATVTGIEVSFGSPTGPPIIDTQAKGSIDLTWQLRATYRESGSPMQPTGGSAVENDASVQVDSPDRIPCDPANPSAFCSDGTGSANAEFNIVAADYTVLTGKVINPASMFENETPNYSTTLVSQPVGNARTVLMTTTDDTPTFWNTMNYTGASIAVPAPVNNVRMDVLVDDPANGKTITWAVVAGQLVASCNDTVVTATAACWTNGDWVSSTGTVNFTLPGGVSATQVVGVRFEARELVNGVPVQWEQPFNPRLSYTLNTTRREFTRSDPTLLVGTDRPDLQPNPGETQLGVITNQVTTHGDAQFGPGQVFTDDATITAATLVKHLVNSIRVTKTRGSAGLINANSTIPYVFTVINTGQWDMTGLKITDQITPLVGDPAESPVIEPTPSAYRFRYTGPNGETGDTTGFAAHLDESTGIITVTVPTGFVFVHGWRITVNAPLLFRPGLDPDTVIHNSVTASSDRQFETCQSTTTDLVAKPDTHNVTTCAADTTVAPSASSVVSMKKWVKGDSAGDPADPTQDDLGVLNVAGTGAVICGKIDPTVYSAGFYTYPCAPITRPGGEETWKLDFTNSGNANARVIASVDTLPAVGDQGVIVPGARGSQFAVSLVGKVQANLDPGATLTAFYSTQVLSPACNTNAIQVYTNNSAANPSCNFGWTAFDATTPESALTGARSVQFVVRYPAATPSAGLRPGATLSIQFDTRTPLVLPKESAVASGEPVAYNSFAGASRTVATASQPEHGELVAEPQRVPVATATGQLQMVKVVNAPDFSGEVNLPTSYPMLVTCTSGGQPITLVHSDGSDASRPSIPSDGSVFVYDNTTGPINLSLFADCTVVEDPKIPGDTATVSPDTALTADRELSTNNQINHPYDGTPDESRWTITNTFTAGGFTVSKAVDNGGAVDQNGTPIVYDQAFSFTASCTYLGQEALALTDRVFTLHDGESKQFTGIPTGADCTVTETDDGGAGSTDVTLTTGGDTSTTTGSSTEFTVGDGDATITTAAFTNHMTVGSVAIDKVITGAGSDLYGQGPFTFTMVCTLAGANPDKVYDDTFTLTPPDDLTKTVDNLPTGASCDVTETDAAGAQATTIDPNPVTVGDGDTQHVTATNEFHSGSLNVHKDLAGAGADIWGQRAFEVTLSCTWNGNKVVVIPGGATRTLSVLTNWNASYDDLPTGAQCTLTETDQGDATDVTITDASGNPAQFPVTIGDETTPVQLTVTNTFDVGQIEVDKIVTGGSANLHTGDTFEVRADCTYNGRPILLIPGGAVRQLTVDTPVVYEDLPVGTDCTISETNNSGANDVRIAPSHVTVGNDTTSHVVVDNVYTVGGFTVTKRVLSDAQNQDGDPIVYDEKFTFHASCTYNGQEMITSDATFRIADDESKSFEDLPTGSDCTVTEVGDGGAASTTVLVTGQGSPGGSLTNGVDFPIGTGDSSITTVRFTNRMPVGSLQIQKVVDGAGAKLWGAGPFTMHVECVLVGADPNVVYDGEVVLGGANPLTATIADLPTGAECHVAETDAAGAQASAIDPKLVKIGDDTTVNVTVTNTFTVGQIVVSKKLAGSGASEHQNDTFHVSLMCVWNGVQVQIPGGDERALTVASPVTYSGLPVGADCTVTETDANGAVGVSMTPASPDNPQTASVVIGDGTTVTVVVTNVFDPSTPVLPVTGGDATIWLIAGGIALLLIGGGAVLLITRRRRRV